MHVLYLEWLLSMRHRQHTRYSTALCCEVEFKFMQSLSWSVREMNGLRQGCRAPEQDNNRRWEVYTRRGMICYSRATLDVEWIKDRGTITCLGNHAIIDHLTRQYSSPQSIPNTV